MLKQAYNAVRNWFSASEVGYPQAIEKRTNVQRPAGAGADYSLEHSEHRLKLLEKARNLERSSPLACAMLDRIVELVVGDGIRPQAQTDSDAWNSLAEELLLEWAERPEVRNLYDLWDAQRLWVRCCERDGDVFNILLNTGQLQTVESDRVYPPLGKENTPSHVGGIDVDPVGRPVTYYVVPRSSLEHIIISPYRFPARHEIAAENMLMWARRQRPTQTRGVSLFATNLSWFKHLDRFVEATVIGARMAACVGLLIETPLPYNTSSSGTTFTGGSAPRFNFEPGMVKTLGPGEQAKTLRPEQPNTQFAEFLRQVVRTIGLPAGLPLEIMHLDFEKSSYSAARAAFMLAFRSARMRQQGLITGLLRPIYRWKIDHFIAQGLLKPRNDHHRHVWTPPGFGWIDPTKEVEAAMMALDGGLTTYSRILTEQGLNFDDMVAQRAREEQALRSAGIELSRSSKTRELQTDPENSEDQPSAEEEEEDVEEAETE